MSDVAGRQKRMSPSGSARHEPRDQLRLTVLGDFAIRSSRGGVAIEIEAPLHRALVTYLMLKPDFRETRERLAELFWGEQTNEQARRNLRQCLFRLRRDLAPLGDDVLVVDTVHIAVDGARLQCDASELLALSHATDLADVDRAIDLCRGPLLGGRVLGKESFDAWFASEAQRVERAATGLMRRGIKAHKAAGNGARAIAISEKLAATDPLDEDLQRLLLRMLHVFEGREAALFQAMIVQKRLLDELGCAPEPETQALIARIKSEPVVRPKLPIPAVPVDMPSIIVLPFQNLSGDPAQNYLAQGFAEDIMTALSRLKWLVVIARDPSDAPDGSSVDLQRLTASSGVRYILQGSIRLAGERIRLSCQVSDAEKRQTIFAQKYDRALGDLFAVQDEITESLVAIIEPYLFTAEGSRAAQRPVERLDSWGLVARAVGMLHRFEREPNVMARALLQMAINLDPTSARAHAILAWGEYWAQHCFWVPDRAEGVKRALELAETAQRIDPNEPWARAVFGFSLSSNAQHERATEELRRSLTQHPSFALGRMLLGWALVRKGDFETATAETERALLLSPDDRFAAVYQHTHGLALLASRRFDEALPFLRAAATPFLEYMGHVNALMSCCGHLGLKDEARRLIEFRRACLGRDFSVGYARGMLASFAHCDVFLEGLSKAGLTE